MTTDRSDLRATIQAIRAERYPDLPEDVVERIVGIEVAYTEDPSERVKQIEQVIDQYLAQEEA